MSKSREGFCDICGELKVITRCLDDNVYCEDCEWAEMSEQWPNGCGELVTSHFSDLEDSYRAFDVWITHCPKCFYIGDCDAG